MRWQYRNTILAVCTAALFVTVFGRLAISPLVPDIASEFRVSNGVIGAALTGMWLAYALTQFPSGVLADQFGDRLIILVSVLGTGLTGVILVIAPGFGVFFLGTVLLGATAGLHYSVGTALISRIYDDIGTAIGIHNTGAPLAGLVTPVVVSWVAVRYGWRPALLLTTLVALPVALLIAGSVRSTGPRRPDEPMREQFERGPIIDLLSRPAVVFTGVIAIISDFTWQAVASFLPAFFVQYHDYSQTLAGVLFAAYFIAQGVLQVGVGVLADYSDRDVATGTCMVTGIGGLALLVAGPSFAGIAAGVVLLGWSMGFGAAVFPRFMDLLSADEQSFGFGVFRTVYMVVAASGPVVVGTLADVFGWAVSFGFLIAILALVVCLLLVNRLLGLQY
jgi:predicted MFS family arabinose efflux permease